MPLDSHRPARAALDAARASLGRLATATAPAEQRALLDDAWQSLQRSLRAMAGSDVLEGVALVRELRQRNLLTLNDAHALVDIHAAWERTRADDAVPTPADLQAARAAEESVARLLSPAPDAVPFSGPVSSPRAPEPATEPARSGLQPETPVRRNLLAGVVVAVALAAVIGGGLYYWRRMGSEPAELRQGRAAFAAGDRLSARNAFAVAATRAPALAEPHIYLGRIAREEGNRAAASAELRRAVELEPANALAHRELASFLLSTGQLDLARTFYQRAIELNPTDRVAMGFMACTLHRMGRTDLAGRFFQRAGIGEWQQCQATPPGIVMPALPPGAIPPAASPPAPGTTRPR